MLFEVSDRQRAAQLTGKTIIYFSTCARTLIFVKEVKDDNDDDDDDGDVDYDMTTITTRRRDDDVNDRLPIPRQALGHVRIAHAWPAYFLLFVHARIRGS